MPTAPLTNSLPASHTAAALAPQTLIGRGLLAVAATGFIAICAHISLPLPFTPVPLTLQPFAVILVGMLLGPVAAFSTLVLYLAEGAIGLPVFNPQGLGGIAQLLGPTAGYLFSYPLAAAVAGLARTPLLGFINRRSQFAAAILSGTVATAILLLSGSLWLAHLDRLGMTLALHLAVLPFLFAEAAKVVAAAGIFSASRRWLL